ncbi:hypothetical protein BDF22DRAFT_702025 [Syncephalis plumigaleata]|nr:hypothetical protein BDF22DRAFT_702025 [Syncephalis plumigaleata]
MTTATSPPTSSHGAIQTTPAVNFAFAERARYEYLCLQQPDRFSYLTLDATLPGYQVYLVEQWALDRQRFCKSVSVFTGDQQHQVKVCVGRTQLNEDYERLCIQSSEHEIFRTKETSLGRFAFAINVNRLNTSLNLLPVPDGDVDVAFGRFGLNVNLRRFGCSGRGSLSLKMPSEAIEDSFENLYHIADNISVYYAVWELGRLIQMSLYLLGLTSTYFVDGLICDTTLAAAKQFTIEYGVNERETGEGPLNPSNVALLLSKVVSARNKLYLLGYQVGKDPFDDPAALLLGVTAFQKATDSTLTGRLDRSTCRLLDNAFLQRGTQTLKVHRMLKSKIDERKGHTHALDVETRDLERFAATVHGVDRLKYLWRGKGRPYNLPEGIPASIGIGELEYYLDHMFMQTPSPKPTTGTTSRRGDFARPARRLGIKITGNKASSMPVHQQSGQMSPTGLGLSLASGPATAAEIGLSLLKLARAHTAENKGKQAHAGGRFERIRKNRNNRKATEVKSTHQPVDTSNQRKHHTLTLQKSFDCLPALYDRERATVEAQQLRRVRSASPDTFTNITPIERLRMDFRVYARYEEYLDYENQLLAEINQLETLSANIDGQIDHLDNVIATRSQSIAEMHKVAQEALQKHQMVGEKVQSSMVEGSKLQYELGVLEERVKEADDFMDDFEQKTHRLQSRLPNVDNHSPPMRLRILQQIAGRGRVKHEGEQQ